MCAFQAKLRRAHACALADAPRTVGHTALNEHLKRIGFRVGTAFIAARSKPSASPFAALQIPPNAT